MRVLIDTNVLFSAALNPNGTPFQAYVKAVTPPNTGIICRQNIEELRRTFNRKLPHKIQAPRNGPPGGIGIQSGILIPKGHLPEKGITPSIREDHS